MSSGPYGEHITMRRRTGRDHPRADVGLTHLDLSTLAACVVILALAVAMWRPVSILAGTLGIILALRVWTRRSTTSQTLWALVYLGVAALGVVCYLMASG